MAGLAEDFIFAAALALRLSLSGMDTGRGAAWCLMSAYFFVEIAQEIAEKFAEEGWRSGPACSRGIAAALWGGGPPPGYIPERSLPGFLFFKPLRHQLLLFVRECKSGSVPLLVRRQPAWQLSRSLRACHTELVQSQPSRSRAGSRN